MRLGLALYALVALSASVQGQEVGDPRWLPWLGCWEPLPAAGEGESTPSGLVVCLRPSDDGRGVELARVEQGEIIARETLVADGTRQELQLPDCSGWQSVSFSADARRIFLRSEERCPGGITRTSSAMMAMASPTRWLEIHSLGMAGERIARVVRYRPAPESNWPSGFAMASDRLAAVRDARLLAAAELSLDDVAEAASQVDGETVIELLAELQQPFRLDAASLASLADRGVPPEVIDVVVAVSFPDRFVVDRQLVTRRVDEREEPRGRMPRYGGPVYWGGPRHRCFGGAWYWSPYCDPYLYWGYGYWGYGWGYRPYGWAYRAPVVVVRRAEPGAKGTVVEGEGYRRGATRSGAGGGVKARPRDPGTNRSPSASPSVGRGGNSGGGSVSPEGYHSGRSSSSGSGAVARKRGS